MQFEDGPLSRVARINALTLSWENGTPADSRQDSTPFGLRCARMMDALLKNVASSTLLANHRSLPSLRSIAFTFMIVADCWFASQRIKSLVSYCGIAKKEAVVGRRNLTIA